MTKPLPPAMHPRHLAEPLRPAELLRWVMLTIRLRQRRRRAEQLRLKGMESSRSSPSEEGEKWES